MSGEIVAALREAAEECRKSSVGNGEYNTAFWVAAIVLDNLARRFEPPASSRVEEG